MKRTTLRLIMVLLLIALVLSIQSGCTKQLVRYSASEFSPQRDAGRPSRTARVSSRASAGRFGRGMLMLGPVRPAAPAASPASRLRRRAAGGVVPGLALPGVLDPGHGCASAQDRPGVARRQRELVHLGSGQPVHRCAGCDPRATGRGGPSRAGARRGVLLVGRAVPLRQSFYNKIYCC